MKRPKPQPQAAAAPRGEALASAAGIAATAAAAVFVVLLAVRPISSFDIGYHLAYGEHFLDTGQIVQTNRFIYTKLPRDVLSDPDQLGPGCRYDPESDTYYFVNANWLSQVAMAAVHRAGGIPALVALQAAMVAAIYGLIILTMRRRGLFADPGKIGAGGVAWHWIALVVVLVAVAANSRFALRPELFAYLVLVGQWCLLVNGRPGRRSVAGVIALQLLAVNLHSYFLLGIALTGAMFAGGFMRWVWARSVTGEDATALARQVKWLAIATAGVIVASLCNPWHVRGAVMPIQTMLFLDKHNITRAPVSGVAHHPWAAISEFFSPFTKHFLRLLDTKIFIGVLAVAAGAGLAALLRRRWGWLAVLAGMTAVSLKMRRNIAPGAMILAPLSVIVLTDVWRRLGELYGRRRARGAPPAVRLLLARGPLLIAAAATALAGWWGFRVVTQQFYFAERRAWRFRTGIADYAVPLEAAEWINTHRPAGRIFCGYDTSSNLMYLTRPRRKVPILTNTWAHPPAMMALVLRLTTGALPFEPFAKEYGVGVVVLRHGPLTTWLIRHLAASADWSTVNVGMMYVVFLRRQGANLALAEKHKITPENFDVQRFVERVAAQDPVPGFALANGAWLLDQVGLRDQAIIAWGRCLEIQPDHHAAMALLAGRLMMRIGAKIERLREQPGRISPDQAERMSQQMHQDWQRAERLLRRALKLKPHSSPYRQLLDKIRRQRAALPPR